MSLTRRATLPSSPYCPVWRPSSHPQGVVHAALPELILRSADAFFLRHAYAWLFPGVFSLLQGLPRKREFHLNPLEPVRQISDTLLQVPDAPGDIFICNEFILVLRCEVQPSVIYLAVYVPYPWLCAVRPDF